MEKHCQCRVKRLQQSCRSTMDIKKNWQWLSSGALVCITEDQIMLFVSSSDTRQQLDGPTRWSSSSFTSLTTTPFYYRHFIISINTPPIQQRCVSPKNFSPSSTANFTTKPTAAPLKVPTPTQYATLHKARSTSAADSVWEACECFARL